MTCASTRHLAGSQVDGVCCALLALQVNIRDLRHLLLACPALLACAPAVLTAQAGTQPACSPLLAACMRHLLVPPTPVMRPRWLCAQLHAALTVIVHTCCCFHTACACHGDKAAACMYALIQSLEPNEAAHASAYAGSLKPEARRCWHSSVRLGCSFWAE